MHKQNLQAYELCLTDMYRVDKITEVGRAIEVKNLARLILSEGQEQAKAVNRPDGKVKLILGMASQSVHCKDGHKAGKL